MPLQANPPDFITDRKYSATDVGGIASFAVEMFLGVLLVGVPIVIGLGSIDGVRDWLVGMVETVTGMNLGGTAASSDGPSVTLH